MGKNESIDIEKNNPIPLYFQVKEDVVQKIKNKVYQVDEQLPPETKLMEMYNVSRTTVRKAVDELVKEGYLEVRRGVGTFIRKPKLNLWDLAELRSFDEEVSRQGLKAKTEVLGLEKIHKNKKLNEIFGDEYDQYYQLERLRYVEEEQSVLVSTYLPAKLVPGIEKFDFSEVSLFDVLQENYQMRINYAEKTFRPIHVNEEDASKLKIKKHTAIQLVETITFDHLDRPVEYSVSRDRGDITNFKVVLKYNKNR